MTTYDVKNGLNLGAEGKRFEPGDVISESELESLTTIKARKWLLEKGHIEEKKSSKKTTKKTTKKVSKKDED